MMWFGRGGRFSQCCRLIQPVALPALLATLDGCGTFGPLNLLARTPHHPWLATQSQSKLRAWQKEGL